MLLIDFTKMLMKKIIHLFFLFVLLNFFVPAKAQTFYVLGGGDYWNMNWNSMQYFTNSYNTGFNSKLSSQFGNFDPMLGWTIGLGFRFAVFSVEYERYGYPSQLLTLAFTSGDKMELQLVSNGYNMNFPIQVPVSDKFWVGLNLGLKSLNGELHVRTVYADGTESYGSEQTTNGIFDFKKRWLLNLGPRIEFGKKIRGYLSATWTMFDPGDVVGLQDLGSDYGVIWTGGMKTVYLPADWANRANDYAYFVGFGPLNRELSGMSIKFGLIVDLYSMDIFK
jgi:hypothetical protein